MKPTPAPDTEIRKRSASRILWRVAAWFLAVPMALLALIYVVLMITPIPLPFAAKQVRNVVLASMPEGSQLELGDMALALEGFVWPVIRFTPVLYTDSKTGGAVSMEALEVGFSPIRALVGQPGATVTIVGPHLQVNQDLFGPRLAKFEYVDDPDGGRTVRVIEGQEAFPDIDLSPQGVEMAGNVPQMGLGMRSDNDWLLYNLMAAHEGIAGIVEQARQGNFSRLVVRGGTLDMNDALYGIFRTFREITLDVVPNRDATGASGEFSLDFAGTVMSGMLEQLPDAEGGTRLVASINNVNVGDFLTFLEDKSAPIKMIGSSGLSIDVGFDPVGKITDGVFHIDLTGTDVELNGAYIPIVSSIAEVKWDPDTSTFTMDEAEFHVGENSGFFKGVFRMGLDPKFGPIISMSMTGRDIVLVSDVGPVEAPFDEMNFTGWSAPVYGAVGIDRFEMKKADGSELAATGRFDMLQSGAGFQLTVAGDKLSAEDVKRLWLPMIAPDSRAWFMKSVVAGRLKASSMRYNFPVGSLDPNSTVPMPADAMTINIVGEDVQVQPLDTMEPIAVDGETRLLVRGENVTISADGATVPTDKGPISIANAALVFSPDTDETQIVEISGDLSSNIKPLVALAKAQQPEALAAAELPISIDSLAGKLSLSLVSTTILDKATGEPRSTDYAVNGVLQDFGSTEPLQGHSIDNGQLSFIASQAGYQLTGQASIDGISADVVIEGKLEENAPPPDMLLSTTIDVADFKKLGFDVSEFLSGKVKFVAKPMADSSIQLAVDLEQAALTIKDLGISKAVGVPGSAKAAIRQTDDLADVSQVDIAFGDVKLAGGLKIDLKQGLQSAEFSTIKLSPGDSASMSMEPRDGGYAVRVRGDQLDLKPMLERFFSLSGGAGGPQATAIDQTIMLDVELKRAVGFYRTTAFNLNLDLRLKGTDLQNVNLQANLGGNRSISVTTNPTNSGRTMSVAFNDLGTLLRLLNIYPNVEGGEGSLVLATNTKEKVDRGQFSLDNFAIVDEKNVAQILGNSRDSRRIISGSGKLEFKSADVDFVRRSDRVEITEALLAGTTVGGTARGFIYTDRGQYDLTGTYVPLFGLNNAFGKLLGPLAGRDGEGLFAVTFAIQGKLDKPEFKINPISALVPGAFRRLFEYRAREIPREE